MNWIKKYTKYDWDTPAIRDVAHYMFFRVYRARKSGMAGAPRGWGKSKRNVAIYAAIMLNYYHSQMSIVNGPKGKSRIFYGLLSILESDKVREDYGDVLESKSKQMGEMRLLHELLDLSGEVTDDPAFIVCTVAGIIGAHCWIVWLEDILQLEAKDSAVNDYLVEEIHNSVIMKLSVSRGGTFTRKGKNDLYSKLPKLGYMMYVKKAIKKLKGSWPTEKHIIYEEEELDGVIQMVAVGCEIPEDSEFEIIDRPGWTISWVLLQRVLDEDSFEREMQNNPQPRTGNKFKKEWYENALIDPFKGNELLYLQEGVIDPAFGKSEASSDTVCITGAMYGGMIYVTEIIVDEDNEDIEELIKTTQEDFNLQDMHVENDYAQMDTRYDQDSILFSELQVSTFTNSTLPGERDKMSRIGTLKKPFKFQKIKIYNTCQGLDLFKDQILSFRPDRPKLKWDILDCMASFVRIIQYDSENLKNKSTIFHI